MRHGASGSFGAQLKALREAAGFTQEELATIAGLSVHAVSALERGERRRPQVETVRALSAALDLTGTARDALLASARAPTRAAALEELNRFSPPLPLTALLGRDADFRTLGTGSPSPPHVSSRSSGPEASGRPVSRWSFANDGAGASPVCCSSGWLRFGTPRSSRRRLPRHSACWTPRRPTCRRRAMLACDGRPDAAGARQFRAGAGRGAAGRGSRDVGHRAAGAGHQPRPAPGARRARIRRGATLAGRWTATRRRPPISRACRRCGSSWSGFATRNRTSASPPRTARP